MKINWKAFLLNAIAVGSCVVVVVPIITLTEMVFPWPDAIEELERRYPDETYIPIGLHASVGGKTDFYETTYLVLPSNVTATVLKKSDTIDYREAKGGFHSYLVGFILWLLVFIFFGMPRIKKMWRGSVRLF
jgi:hypothetical protein